MKNLSEADKLRAEYLEICELLAQHAKDSRGFAMDPGNTWLARAELAKIVSLTNDLESLLDDIKKADETSR